LIGPESEAQHDILHCSSFYVLFVQVCVPLEGELTTLSSQEFKHTTGSSYASCQLILCILLSDLTLTYLLTFLLT